MPPEPLDAAILFAPVGDLVLPAMAALDCGGTLAIAGIYLTDIPALSYDRYLFQERQLRSVTSNTRQDATSFRSLRTSTRSTRPTALWATSRPAASTAPPSSSPSLGSLP
jgi:propanol-preferring alcohol dehydrogenase